MPTLADSVAKLTAICTFPGCGADATRTQRLVNNQPAAIDDPLIVIGGTEGRGEPDRYEARSPLYDKDGTLLGFDFAKHSLVTGTSVDNFVRQPCGGTELLRDLH